jgi:hypothetical protein
MTKKVWAEGRKEKPCTIAISPESRDIANKLAAEARMTTKDFIALLLYKYGERSEKKYERVIINYKGI